jgi:hypothetical protein
LVGLVGLVGHFPSVRVTDQKFRNFSVDKLGNDGQSGARGPMAKLPVTE